MARVNLSSADLSQANLTNAQMPWADLSQAELSGARLDCAYMVGANLRAANLRDARLFRTDLNSANFTEADLTDAELGEADLYLTQFSTATLYGANLTDASLGRTTFSNSPLMNVVGLDSCGHKAGSHMDASTLRSSGQLPEKLLRGCGLTDWEIEQTKLYRDNLTQEEIIDITYKVAQLRGRQPIHISPIFISYTRTDESFVKTIEKRLNDHGVRSWRDVHDLVAGPLEKQIDRAIRNISTVLLVLSENSVNSYWVEAEAEKGLTLQRDLKRSVLCPVALDDSWKDCDWDPCIRQAIKRFNVLNFSNWQDPQVLDSQMDKLLKGLSVHYGEGAN